MFKSVPVLVLLPFVALAAPSKEVVSRCTNEAMIVQQIGMLKIGGAPAEEVVGELQKNYFTSSLTEQNVAWIERLIPFVYEPSDDFQLTTLEEVYAFITLYYEVCVDDEWEGEKW